MRVRDHTPNCLLSDNQAPALRAVGALTRRLWSMRMFDGYRDTPIAHTSYSVVESINYNLLSSQVVGDGPKSFANRIICWHNQSNTKANNFYQTKINSYHDDRNASSYWELVSAKVTTWWREDGITEVLHWSTKFNLHDNNYLSNVVTRDHCIAAVHIIVPYWTLSMGQLTAISNKNIHTSLGTSFCTIYIILVIISYSLCK